MKKVCIIGAGGAGLAAIRHVNASDKLTGVVFERTEDIGGIWNYTDKIGKDTSGKLIHSPIYKGLRTNLPKQIMGYLDYQFKEGNDSFIYHDEVLNFLRDFADDFNLLKNIQFNTRVISVKPLSSESESSVNDFPTDSKWEVTVQKDSDDKPIVDVYDAVIICNGHYCTPSIPEIKNLQQFRGKVIHSRDYRIPEPFSGKRVVVLGSGPSGIDIMLEIANVASEIYLSLRKPPYTGSLPGHVRQVLPVTEIRNNCAVLENGDEIECDVLLLCTGYYYDYPFLSPECGLEITKGKLIHPLYRHMINAKFPSMALIGIPFRVCPFILFDAQVRHFVKYLEGEVKLPSMNKMILDINENSRSQQAKGIPFNRSHELEQLQWEYFKTLGIEAGFSHLLKPFVRKVYEAVGKRRQTMPEIYKNDQLVVEGDDNFILHEAL